MPPSLVRLGPSQVDLLGRKRPLWAFSWQLHKFWSLEATAGHGAMNEERNEI
jgi:hypothetical protein